MAYKPKPGEVAGLDLVGYRQPDGSILLGTATKKTPMPDFPKEVEACGVVFKLEYTKKNDDPPGKLPANHPGKNLEWGIYC